LVVLFPTFAITFCTFSQQGKDTRAGLLEQMRRDKSQLLSKGDGAHVLLD
jgi:hypothetical protein